MSMPCGIFSRMRGRAGFVPVLFFVVAAAIAVVGAGYLGIESYINNHAQVAAPGWQADLQEQERTAFPDDEANAEQSSPATALVAESLADLLNEPEKGTAAEPAAIPEPSPAPVLTPPSPPSVPSPSQPSPLTFSNSRELENSSTQAQSGPESPKADTTPSSSYVPPAAPAETAAPAVESQPVGYLTAVKNPAYPDPLFIGNLSGVNNAKLASFIFTAAPIEGVRVAVLTFDKDENAAFDIRNVRVAVNGMPFGAARTQIGNEESDLTFAGNAFEVPRGGSVTVDVFGDILDTTESAYHRSVIDLTGWSAVGGSSHAAILFPGEIEGQNDTVGYYASGGFGIAVAGPPPSDGGSGGTPPVSSGPALGVSLASASAPAGIVVMNSTNDPVVSIRFAANNMEAIRLTNLVITDTMSGVAAGGVASFQSVTLWDGGTQVAGPAPLVMAGSNVAKATLSMASDVVVPKNGSKTLTVKGDVASFSSGGARDGSVHTFSVANTADVTVYGKDSSQSAEIQGSATGNPMTVYRTMVYLASSLLGSSSGRARVAVDDLATLSLTAHSAYQATVKTVTLNFSGSAVASAGAPFAVSLLDTATNAPLGAATEQTCVPSASGCSVTFSPAVSVDAGTTKQTKVRVDSSAFGAGSLSVRINNTTDVIISDGTVSAIPLDPSFVPFTVTAVSY